MGTWALVAGALLFAASFASVHLVPRGSWLVLGAVLAGAGIGIAVHAIVHAAFLGGSRTLWPFEIVLFLALGLLPAAAGHLLGRITDRRPRTRP